LAPCSLLTRRWPLRRRLHLTSDATTSSTIVWESLPRGLMFPIRTRRGLPMRESRMGCLLGTRFSKLVVARMVSSFRTPRGASRVTISVGVAFACQACLSSVAGGAVIEMTRLIGVTIDAGRRPNRRVGVFTLSSGVVLSPGNPTTTSLVGTPGSAPGWTTPELGLGVMVSPITTTARC
jgi:hypothetical protein